MADNEPVPEGQKPAEPAPPAASAPVAPQATPAAASAPAPPQAAPAGASAPTPQAAPAAASAPAAPQAAPPPPPRPHAHEHEHDPGEELEHPELVAGPKPWVSWAILAGNVVLFVVAAMRTQGQNSWFAPSGKALESVGKIVIDRSGEWANLHTQPWRLFTCLFVSGLGFNALINAMLLFQLGPELERILGKVRFALLYVFGGLAALLTLELMSIYGSYSGPRYAGAGASHAAFATYGAVFGLIMASKGPIGLFTSRIFWSRVAWIGGLVLIGWLLVSQTRSPVGIDVTGWLTDMGVGWILGYGLTLSLMPGVRKPAGFALTIVFVLATCVEAGVMIARSAGVQVNTDGGVTVTPPPPPGKNPPKQPPPRPRTPPPPPPVSKDGTSVPSEVESMREKAKELLDRVGQVPRPTTSEAVKQEARGVYDALDNFERRYVPPKGLSETVYTEMAQLKLVVNDLETAKTQADDALRLLGEGQPGKSPAKGSPNATRLARCHGVLAMVAIERQEEIVARQQLLTALEWDAQVPELHFWLGKLATSETERKRALERYLDLVGTPPPTSQEPLVEEARRILGR